MKEILDARVLCRRSRAVGKPLRLPAGSESAENIEVSHATRYRPASQNAKKVGGGGGGVLRGGGGGEKGGGGKKGGGGF